MRDCLLAHEYTRHIANDNIVYYNDWLFEWSPLTKICGNVYTLENAFTNGSDWINMVFENVLYHVKVKGAYILFHD